MRENKALITLVAGLGAVIALLFGAIGYGFYRQASDPDFRMFGAAETPAPAPVGLPAAIAGPPEIPILLAPGSDLVSWETDGGRLILHVAPASGGDELIVVDMDRGRVIRRVVVRTQP